MQSRSRQDVSGWLISPEGNWCYSFHKDPKSWKRYPFVFVDKWSTQADGSPLQMKYRSKLPLDEALELCAQMLLDGWQKLSYQFDEGNGNEFIDELAA